MDQEIYNLHHVVVPDNYLPNPEAHLNNARDRYHFEYLSKLISDLQPQYVLDVGAWDSWLGILLAKRYPSTTIITCEVVTGLAYAAQRYITMHGLTNITAVPSAWETLELHKTFDIVSCFEVLEHVRYAEVPAYVTKMEACSKHVVISLPEQSHHDNKQHQWTPDMGTIYELLRPRNFGIDKQSYPGTNIPSNFFVHWKVTHD